MTETAKPSDVQTLTLALHSGRNTPSVRQALRRLIANALDARSDRRPAGVGEPDLEFVAAECEPTGTVRLFNPGASLPRRALLVGWSGPRRRGLPRGRYGEGLPTALLALAHRGHPVVVRTGREIWRPAIRRDNELGADVLVIDTEPDDHDGVEVTVEGVRAEDWFEAREHFLELDPTYDPEQTARGASDGSERVLLQPRYRGRVYARGEWLVTDDSMAFGYDLDLELDRDDPFFDADDLQHRCGEVLRQGIVLDGARLLPRIERALFDEPDRTEAGWNLEALTEERTLRTFLAERFHQRFGDHAIPVADVTAAERAEFLGRRGVVVGPLAQAILTPIVGGLDGLVSGRGTGMEITRSWPLDELADGERDVLLGCIALVNEALPTWKPNVVVVDFSMSLAGTFDRETGRVQIARSVLESRAMTLTTLVHEVAHRVGIDGSYDHVESQVAILARIAAKRLDPPRD